MAGGCRSLRTAARHVLLTIALVGASGVAHAGDVETARKIFSEGVKLYQKGDYEGARRLFKQADAEHHAPPIVYNLALAEEKLEHRQAALDAYEAYIAEVGDKGDLATAAAVAIAQIKSRSTKLRIETKPSGAHVFVDGSALNEPAPTSVLVAAGHHVVVAQGEGWRGEEDISVEGKGDTLAVTLAEAAPPEPAPVEVTPPPTITPPPADRPSEPLPLPQKPQETEGLVWGAAFAVVPVYLFGVNTRDKSVADTQTTGNARDAATVVAGPMIELGLALSPDFVFMARGFAGLGPDGKPAYSYMGGPGLSFRVGPRIWLGATFLGGRLETRAHDAPYGTDLVFGALTEANLVVLKKSEGEWIAGIQPAFLLTHLENDNTALFFPLTFGYRAY